MTRIILSLCFLIIACSVAGADSGEGDYRAEDWVELNKKIRKKFPDAPVIKVAELEKKDLKDYLILDCRTKREFETSHIKGALHSEKLDTAKRNLKLQKGRPVVVYCSVGYRSGKMVEALVKDGAKNVSNLEGSIFTWANRGNPLEDDEGRSTSKVDRYGWRWGKYLRPEYRD